MLGLSLKMIAPRISEPIGWIISSSEVNAAGSRGSDIVISIQPSTCDVSASVISHAAPGQTGTKCASPQITPMTLATIAAVSVMSNSGPAGRRRSTPPRRSNSSTPT